MENRVVTIIGLITSVCGVLATIYPETHTVGMIAAVVGAVAAAVGKTLWPDKFLGTPSVPDVKPQPSDSAETKPILTVKIPLIRKEFKDQ